MMKKSFLFALVLALLLAVTAAACAEVIQLDFCVPFLCYSESSDTGDHTLLSVKKAMQSYAMNDVWSSVNVDTGAYAIRWQFADGVDAETFSSLGKSAGPQAHVYSIGKLKADDLIGSAVIYETVSNKTAVQVDFYLAEVLQAPEFPRNSRNLYAYYDSSETQVTFQPTMKVADGYSDSITLHYFWDYDDNSKIQTNPEDGSVTVQLDESSHFTFLRLRMKWTHGASGYSEGITGDTIVLLDKSKKLPAMPDDDYFSWKFLDIPYGESIELAVSPAQSGDPSKKMVYRWSAYSVDDDYNPSDDQKYIYTDTNKLVWTSNSQTAGKYYEISCAVGYEGDSDSFLHFNQPFGVYCEPKKLGSVTLPVSGAAVMEDGTQLRIAEEKIAEIPAQIQEILTERGVSTVDEMEAYMETRLREMNKLASPAVSEQQSSKMMDVQLEMYNEAIGKWEKVTAETFPENGLTITLEYPAGTSASTHRFYFLHLFTEGEFAGRIESGEMVETPYGLQATLTGCSPVMVLWEEYADPAPSAPKTGDSTPLAMLVVLMVFSAAGLACLLSKRSAVR